MRDPHTAWNDQIDTILTAVRKAVFEHGVRFGQEFPDVDPIKVTDPCKATEQAEALSAINVAVLDLVIGKDNKELTEIGFALTDRRAQIIDLAVSAQNDVRRGQRGVINGKGAASPPSVS